MGNPGGDLAATKRSPQAVLEVKVGDYLCSERDLYCVEQLGSEHALIEDCRTGELIDMPLGKLLLLQRVRQA